MKLLPPPLSTKRTKGETSRSSNGGGYSEWSVFYDETTLTKLGPAVYSEVTVNGVKVTALIDTGSPVTLMSLKKAVQILALRTGEFRSPQEWKETTIAQLQTPTVLLKSYSGDTLNVVAQLLMILGQDDQEVSSLVLI